MSLPFADRPEESRVYQDLKTKVLTNLTADEFDSLKASMFAEGVSGLEDEYRRLLLLGLASDKISTSGPIPGTFQVVETSLTSASTFSAFTCPANEVYQIIAASTEAFATNQSYLIMKIKDNVSNKSVRIDDLSGGNKEFELGEPIYISGTGTTSSEILLQAGQSGTWSGTNLVQIGLIRVR
jgi:hypothetical protein